MIVKANNRRGETVLEDNVQSIISWERGGSREWFDSTNSRDRDRQIIIILIQYVSTFIFTYWRLQSYSLTYHPTLIKRKYEYEYEYEALDIICNNRTTQKQNNKNNNSKGEEINIPSSYCYNIIYSIYCAFVVVVVTI